MPPDQLARLALDHALLQSEDLVVRLAGAAQ